LLREALVPLLEWRAGRPAEGFRRLESRVDAGLLGRLAATQAPPDAVPLHGALQAAMDLFIDLQIGLDPRYGLTEHATAGDAIRTAVERAWRS
jgi:hypothetical protein